MSLKKIHSVKIGNKEAKVYRDSEWNEYRVSFYVDGVKLPNGDYHADDKDDAIDTADWWCEQ